MSKHNKSSTNICVSAKNLTILCASAITGSINIKENEDAQIIARYNLWLANRTKYVGWIKKIFDWLYGLPPSHPKYLNEDSALDNEWKRNEDKLTNNKDRVNNIMYLATYSLESGDGLVNITLDDFTFLDKKAIHGN